MLTLREARLRAEIHNGRIVFDQEYQEYRVTLNEWTRSERERMTYFTDDLEDAVLTLGQMRKDHRHAA